MNINRHVHEWTIEALNSSTDLHTKMAGICVSSFIASLLILLLLWAPPVQSYPDGGRKVCPRENFNTTAKTASCSKSLALQTGGLIFVKLDFDDDKPEEIGKLGDGGVQSCGGSLITSNGAQFQLFPAVPCVCVRTACVWLPHCAFVLLRPAGVFSVFPCSHFSCALVIHSKWLPLHDTNHMSSRVVLCCVVLIQF